MRKTADWPLHLMGSAEHAATKSKDSTQVGAVLVDTENTELCTGFNGPPRGVLDKPERFERPAKYLFAAHAEANVIATAARHGIATRGLSLFVTHRPCADCAKLIIQAGIKRVCIGSGETRMETDPTRRAGFEAADEMFREAGVGVSFVRDVSDLKKDA